ncbi:MAG: tyrosine-type recombinase/integrase [Kibdelosporangium sp.]
METQHRFYRLVREWQRTLKAEDKSPRTIEGYVECVDLLVRFIDQLDEPPAEVNDITDSMIKDFIADQLGRHKPSTACTRYRGVRQWFNWLVLEEEADRHPMAKMKPPELPPIPVPVVKDDVWERVLAQCTGRDFMSRRDAAIIRLFTDNGPRLSEVANLRVEDLDLDVIHVVGKGRRPRAVPFSPKTGQALSRYLRVRENDRWAHHERLWLAEKGKGPLTANGIKLMLRDAAQHSDSRTRSAETCTHISAGTRPPMHGRKPAQAPKT